MHENSQLAATITPHTGRYDRCMRGDTTPPPPPYRGYSAPSPRRNSPWILFASIVIAGLLIAAATFGGIYLTNDTNPAAPTADTETPAPTTALADSPTCQAWKATRQTMLSIPDLPQGWDWDTPNLDTYISNRTNAIERALEIFETEIADDQSTEVTESASTYIATRRDEIAKLRSHTYTSVDRVTSEAAVAELNQLCGELGG